MPYTKIMVAWLLLGLVVGGSEAGGAVTIDFDGLPGMSNSVATVVPAASRLSDAFAPLGVVFSSGEPYVAVVNLGPGHAPSGTNAIGGSRPVDLLTYSAAYPVVATFVDPNNSSLPAITDFVSVRTDLIGSGGLDVTLNAYDLGGALLGFVTVADTGGQTLSISVPGIHSVQFIGTSDNRGVALDDFTFGSVTAPQPVPALSPLGLFLAGLILAAAGWTLVRRVSRTRVRAAATT